MALITTLDNIIDEEKSKFSKTVETYNESIKKLVEMYIITKDSKSSLAECRTILTPFVVAVIKAVYDIEEAYTKADETFDVYTNNRVTRSEMTKDEMVDKFEGSVKSVNALEWMFEKTRKCSPEDWVPLEDMIKKYFTAGVLGDRPFLETDDLCPNTDNFKEYEEE